jgi:hypothetical protein
MRTDTRTYPTGDSATAVLIGTTRNRLSGFGTNIPSESQTVDPEGTSRRKNSR